MNSHPLSILNQIASGELSADQAAALLNGATASAPQADTTNRWLRVRVTNMDTGRTKVNVNMPLSFVKAGLKIGAAYEPEIANLDWQEIVNGLSASAGGKIVEVEDEEDRERVEVYVD